MKRIHIFGASGSGTTTLAAALACTLNCRHFDTDDYYWLRTEPPFVKVRDRRERQALLKRDLEATDSWVLSGSLCGWGDFAIELFHMVIFLWVPPDTRMERLRRREIQRYGPEIEEPSHPMFKAHSRFLQWAEQYDTGDLDMRSKALHENWLAKLRIPVLRLEGPESVEVNLSKVLATLSP